MANASDTPGSEWLTNADNGSAHFEPSAQPKLYVRVDPQQQLSFVPISTTRTESGFGRGRNLMNRPAYFDIPVAVRDVKPVSDDLYAL